VQITTARPEWSAATRLEGPENIAAFPRPAQKPQ
jgi:hypothetical protein